MQADDCDGSSGQGQHDNDVQYELDVDYDHREKESFDMLWEVKAKTFRSEGEAYVFYNQYARERGFSVRRDRLKKGKDVNATIRLRRYLCSKAGKRRTESCSMEGRTRTPRQESRCNCEAHLTIKIDRDRNIWFVSSFTDDH